MSSRSGVYVGSWDCTVTACVDEALRSCATEHRRYWPLFAAATDPTEPNPTQARTANPEPVNTDTDRDDADSVEHERIMRLQRWQKQP